MLEPEQLKQLRDQAREIVRELDHYTLYILITYMQLEMCDMRLARINRIRPTNGDDKCE